MGLTISKRRQPGPSRLLKEGRIFFRVQRFGQTIQDFKTKKAAKKFVAQLKKRR